MVIVSDTPVLRRDAQSHAAHFSLSEAEALGARRGEAFLGRQDSGPVFAFWLDDSALAPHAAPEAGAYTDKRALAIDMAVSYFGPRKKDVSFTYYNDLAAMARAVDVLVVRQAAARPHFAAC